MPEQGPLRAGATGGRAAALVSASVVAAALLVVAVLFSNSSTASQVAANARSLHAANAAAGSAAIARLAQAQAVVFVSDHALGVASAAAASQAMAEAETALDNFRDAAAALPRLQPSLAPPADAFVEAAEEVLSLLSSAQVVSAEQARQQLLEPAYTQLEAGLGEWQEAMVGSISSTEDVAGRTAWFTQLAVTVAIPATAMGFYWWWVRRRMRERERDMESRLEAERALNRAKDEFVAGLSHELRTPLTSIYGFSEVLVETGMVDASTSRDLLGLINHEAAELSRMVEDLLTAARLDAGALTVQLAEVDLATEVEAVVAPFRRSGLELTVECPQAVVVADPLRLRQIIRNLVSNAQRHGGPNLALVAACHGDHITLSVFDDGPGVSPEIEERLFHRFVNSGRRALLAGSVGLGLAVAQELAVGMGTTIEYGRRGGLTVFSIDLPRVDLTTVVEADLEPVPV
jgi:signal transduction histidine kinase